MFLNRYEKKFYIVMVNKFTNINKRIITSPQIIVFKKKITTYDVGNPGSGLGHAKNSCGVKRLIGSQSSPSS